VLVGVADTSSESSSVAENALNRGIERRLISLNGKRGHLLVVSPNNNKEEWIQHQVLSGLLRNITPNRWESFEFVSFDAINNYSTPHPLVEVESSSTILNLLFGNDEDASTQIKLFHRLLQQVIHSKYSGSDIPSMLLQYHAVQEDDTKPSSIIQKEDEEVNHEITKVENQSSDVPVELKNSQLQEDPNDSIQAILSKAHTQLEFLETKMGEVLLKTKDYGSSNNPMPLFEFGKLAQDILDKTDNQLQTLDKNGHIPSSLRKGLLRSVTKRVQILYNDQLQALRNYYGQ
jgi:hypothetical protein